MEVPFPPPLGEAADAVAGHLLSMITGTRIVAGAVLAGLVGAGGYALWSTRDNGTAPPVTAVATGTAEVRRADVAERQYFPGTLGYAGDYHVIAPGPGTLTWLPAIGAVVSRGQTVYEVSGAPVVLMYGGRPAWRAFAAGMPDGPDVEQLESNLARLGHGTGLTVDQRFTGATDQAVRRWQRATGRAVTGQVALGQVVFLPDAVRISAHDVRVGAEVQPGGAVAHGTGDQPVITIQVQPRRLPSAKVGDPVLVTLPGGGGSRPGRITEIGAVAAATVDNGRPDNQQQATVPVTVRVNEAISGFLDQASVQVAITVRARQNVLAVPITALNARPGGAYEVVVVDGATTRAVTVRTGLFDEAAGLVEVSGPDLVEGQRVRVPGDTA